MAKGNNHFKASMFVNDLKRVFPEWPEAHVEYVAEIATNECNRGYVWDTAPPGERVDVLIKFGAHFKKKKGYRKKFKLNQFGHMVEYEVLFKGGDYEINRKFTVNNGRPSPGWLERVMSSVEDAHFLQYIVAAGHLMYIRKILNATMLEYIDQLECRSYDDVDSFESAI